MLRPSCSVRRVNKELFGFLRGNTVEELEITLSSYSWFSERNANIVVVPIDWPTTYTFDCPVVFRTSSRTAGTSRSAMYCQLKYRLSELGHWHIYRVQDMKVFLFSLGLWIAISNNISSEASEHRSGSPQDPKPGLWIKLFLTDFRDSLTSRNMVLSCLRTFRNLV